MNPYHHALSSAEKYGGQPEDYLPLHQWFDESKAFIADFRHRAMRHHAEGIFLAERIFGVTLTNSAGRQIPTRFVGEQHVKEDLGRIPTAQDWLECIAPQAWMLRSGKSNQHPSTNNPQLPSVCPSEDARRFLNHYRCPRCGKSWTDQWSATCDDDCPHCGARHISPVYSEDAEPQISGKARQTLTVGELIEMLQQLAAKSPLGKATSVCIARLDADYEEIMPPVLQQDPDGAVGLLTPICRCPNENSFVRAADASATGKSSSKLLSVVAR